MCESLRWLKTNERMSESLIFLEQIVHLLIFGQKTSDLLGKPMSEVPALFISNKEREDNCIVHCTYIKYSTVYVRVLQSG